MEAVKIIDKLPKVIKDNLVSILLGFFGFILLSYGLISLIKAPDSSEEISLETQNQSETTTSSGSIKVDVEGAVVHPGVYTLPIDSRYKDALIAAGGMSARADRDFVSKAINLAAKLKDGEKIYILYEGEKTGSSLGLGNTAGSVININTATESELDTLPGIGKVTALKIIQGRPYSQIEDLTSKKTVSQSVFEKIKNLISAY